MNILKRNVVAVFCAFVGIAALADAVHATVTVSEYTIRMTATADTYTPTVAKRVVGVKLSGADASKYYRLRRTDASGVILWEHKTNAGGTTTTLDNSPPLDAAVFKVPSGVPLYFQTDDAGTPSLGIYTDQGI